MAYFNGFKGVMAVAAVAIAVISGGLLQAAAQTLPSGSPTAQRRPTTGNLGFSLQGVRPSRQRIGGFARGSCVETNTPLDLTAVQPAVNRQGQLDIETTVSARPVLFVYIPRTTAKQASLIFSQEDRANIESRITLPGRPGVIGITLPVELQVGKPYHWSLALVCDEEGTSTDPAFIEGWLQRQALDPALARTIERTAQRDRPALFARSGYWQDTLTALATLHLENPADASLRADWASLMQSVNLTALANEPVIQFVEAQVTASDPLPLPSPPPVLTPAPSSATPPPAIAPILVLPTPATPR
ncbi:MAG TPA: DUF928 domain-containing protein [Synechococcales cyanobacterium M55_K2018_004]|nr:DUF928 domain-containing protein [Synechococcales cyanobacterium M55_K2018_004]